MLNERIRRARILRAMSLQQVADAIGDISKQALSKFETGQDTPSSTRIIQLAKILGLKPEYFFRPDTVVLGQVDFRKKTRLTNKQQEAVLEQTREHLERYVALEATFDADPLPCLFKDDQKISVSTQQDAENAAKELRSRWEIGFDAIQSLTELLEDRGIKVVEIDAPEAFDGMCARLEDTNEAVIIINQNKPGERQRFTVAHELGHLIMDVPDSVDDKAEENLCHRFAGAFLMPERGVRADFGDKRSHVHFRELKLAKENYGISMQAALRRLLDLEIISASVYQGMMIQFSKEGYRKNEPWALASERPTRFESLVYRGLAEGLFTPSKAAEFLQTHVAMIEQSLEEASKADDASSDL